MRIAVVAVFFCCLSLCSCGTSGPSDARVASIEKQLFESQAKFNPYYGTCGKGIETQVLNKEVQGKEAMVSVEITWHSQMFNCNEHMANFSLHLMNPNGKWVLYQ